MKTYELSQETELLRVLQLSAGTDHAVAGKCLSLSPELDGGGFTAGPAYRRTSRDAEIMSWALRKRLLTGNGALALSTPKRGNQPPFSACRCDLVHGGFANHVIVIFALP